MCVVPDGAGKWRFARHRCLRTGAVVHREEERWSAKAMAGGCALPARTGCEADVHEEEDELRLPEPAAAVRLACAPIARRCRVCGLPRASWSADDAGDLRIADRHGNMQLSLRGLICPETAQSAGLDVHVNGN